VRINGNSDGVNDEFAGDCPFSVEARLHLHQDYFNAQLFCMIDDYLGESVVHHRVNCRDIFGRPLSVGGYKLRVEMPILWLAPGAYTLRFKFFGLDHLGSDWKCESERVLINVTGGMDGLSRARLAPSARWLVESEEINSAEVDATLSLAV
jgi:hypothetical protein